MPYDDRLVGTNAILGRPLLIQNPLTLHVADGYQVLPTTITATVAVPVLNCRQRDTMTSHAVIVVALVSMKKPKATPWLRIVSTGGRSSNCLLKKGDRHTPHSITCVKPDR